MRTLVLNAGYEPLSVVSSRRAALLVMRGRASVLAEEGTPIVSPSALMPRPAVILLHRYVRVVRRRPSAPSRRGVLRRDGRICVYCSRPAGTVDHVVPRSRGGESSWENLVACCGPCNVTKGDKTLEQLGWSSLRRRRHPPTICGFPRSSTPPTNPGDPSSSTPDTVPVRPLPDWPGAAGGAVAGALPGNLAAVLLAGGEGRRLGGTDKARLRRGRRRCCSTGSPPWRSGESP